jgi:autotransporter-associated beta strand protein
VEALSGNDTLIVGNGNATSNFGGVLKDNGAQTLALTKTGSGTLTLSGDSSYTGATLVSAGTLLVNGSLGNTAVTVGAAGTFGGSGSLGGNLELDATSIFQVVDFNDPLNVAGTITFGSGFGIANLSGFDWDALDLDSPYTLVSTTQTFGISDIANFGYNNRVAVGALGREAYFTSGSLAVIVIPEPQAALLGGLSLLVLMRRRR